MADARALTLAMIGLWVAVIAQDLRRREVTIFVLGALAVSSLFGRSWPWWLLIALILLWPPQWRDRATFWLPPCAIVAGAVTGEPPGDDVDQALSETDEKPDAVPASVTDGTEGGARNGAGS